MKNQSLDLLGLAALSTLALAGCGGGGSTILEAAPNGLPYGAPTNRATQAALENTYRGVEIDVIGRGSSYTASSAAHGELSAASVTLVNSNTLRLKMGGNSYDLALSGGQFVQTDGNTTRTVVPAFAGTASQSVYFFAVQEENPVDVEFADSYLVTGFSTRPSEITSALGQVNYNGLAALVARVNDGGALVEAVILDDTEQVVTGSGDGAVALSVDFAAASNQITGTITGTVTDDFGGGSLELDLVGSLSGSEFSGTFTKDTVNSTNTGITFSAGGFEGGFFGPGAADIAGTLSAGISGSGVPGGSSAATGVFIGSD